MKHAFRYRGTVIRANKPYWTHRPTSGDGAAKFGGRFNPIGVPALYASLSFITAGKEVRFTLNAEPYTFYHLEVDCEGVLDLTSTHIRSDLGVDWAELECPNWESEMHRRIVPASHQLATRLIADGYAGILVNSFAAGATADDVNLVLWRWDDMTDREGQSRHSVRVLNRDMLPKDTRSWEPDRDA